MRSRCCWLPLQLEIPDGYRGYVVLHALSSCPVLPRRGGYTVIRFGDDGRACTSEPDPFVIKAIDQCRWDDAKCWEDLRSR